MAPFLNFQIYVFKLICIGHCVNFFLKCFQIFCWENEILIRKTELTKMESGSFSRKTWSIQIIHRGISTPITFVSNFSFFPILKIYLIWQNGPQACFHFKQDLKWFIRTLALAPKAVYQVKYYFILLGKNKYFNRIFWLPNLTPWHQQL